MALSANTVWEIQPGVGSANNGGGFVAGASGEDKSQQAAAGWALTGVTTAGADAILLHADAAATMVGNVAYIASGTNFIVGRYQVLSVVVGVSITLDRTCTSAAGSGGVVNIGGAVASLATIATAVVAGNKIWEKATGTADEMTAFTVSVIAGTLAAPTGIEGYNTTRGDLLLETWAEAHNPAGFLDGHHLAYPTLFSRPGYSTMDRIHMFVV